MSTERYSFHIIEPQIFKFGLQQDIELGLEDAKAMIATSVELSAGEKYAVLFDVTRNGSITMEARQEFADSKYRVAAAILTGSVAKKLISNFFITFHRPATPTRVFSDEAQAIQWLKERLAGK